MNGSSGVALVCTNCGVPRLNDHEPKVTHQEMVNVNSLRASTSDCDAETENRAQWVRQSGPEPQGPIRTPGSDEAKLCRESSLISAARRGNVQAFEQLIRPLQRTIFRLGLRITGNREDAEEVLQDSLFKAWKNLYRFQGKARFSTWMVSIARNEALMKLRELHSDRFVNIEDRVDDEGELRPWTWYDQRPNPEQLLLQAEFHSVFFHVAQMLNPTCRRVFLLRYLNELTTRETAMALRMSCSAVKSRAHRARRYLRSMLCSILDIRHISSDGASAAHAATMRA